MRVLLACVRYPPAPGGAEAHVAALAEGLVARGHDVEVFTTDLQTEVPFVRDASLPAEVNGVPVRRFRARTPGGEAHYVLAPSMAPALVRASRVSDVVHAHSYGYGHTLLAASAARLARTPFVFTPHFHPPWSMEGGARRGQLRAVYDRSLGPWSLRAADAVLAVTNEELSLLRHVLGLALPGARVIPNGIHPARFALADGRRFRAAWGLGDDPVVLYAGRLASNKGLRHLVEAFAILRREAPGARLVLAGADQDQGPALDALAAHLRVPITRTGHLPEEEYPHALAASDVFVLPSEYEAFGIVLLEAMACGVPVVATRVGGVPDVVADGEDGVLVPYGDPPALAAAIGGLLRDPGARRKAGERGRAKAQRYAWDRVVGEVEEVYRALAAR